MKSLFKLTALLLASLIVFSHFSCDTPIPASAAPVAKTAALSTPATASPAETVVADAATIIGRKEVPILCYHQLRDWTASDSKAARDYIVPVNTFRQQMQSLADSGYYSIQPDQLFDYLVKGTPLPSKPVMITFDDTRMDQYTVALPELNKHGFKGVYFIMTVSLGRPGYMSAAEVKQLSDEGNTIGSHTWDHHNVKKYVDADWLTQIQKPSQQLEKITGKPIGYFAYPFGLWNKEAIAQLKKFGFKSVFQLSADRDENDPLYSVRRIIVPGDWSASTMQRVMKNSF